MHPMHILASRSAATVLKALSFDYHSRREKAAATSTLIVPFDLV